MNWTFNAVKMVSTTNITGQMLYSGASLDRGSTFAGLKNIQKIKKTKNIKLKLEITFKVGHQKAGFTA